VVEIDRGAANQCRDHEESAQLAPAEDRTSNQDDPAGCQVGRLVHEPVGESASWSDPTRPGQVGNEDRSEEKERGSDRSKR
jgi:hypothetical protein